MSSKRLSLLVNFLSVDKLSGSLRNIIALGKRGSTSINALRGEGRKLENQLRDVRREIDRSSGNVTELVNQERALERQIAETNRQIERRGRLNAIEGDRRALVARGEALQARGRSNVTQGAAIAAPLVLAVAQAAQFSSGMVDIQQKLELSDRQADSLRGRIVKMSDAAKVMPEDMRAGLDTLAGLGGLSLQQIEAALGPAGKLATAYKVDLADAAAAAHASITNLQVPAAQASRIFDTMAKSGNEGGFEVRDMARHFPSLTAQMRALGQTGIGSVADLSAALQVARASAGNADEAANNIANLLQKINSPGTIRAFEKNFGVNLPAAMAKLEKQGFSAMEAIALVTKQATGGDLRQLAFAFEDRQAQAGVRALILGMDEFRRVRQEALDSEGTVKDAFDQRVARDATVQWSAFKSSAAQLAITMGSTLLPVANETLGMITGLANKVAAWAQANPEAAATVTKLVAGLAVFKIGLGVAQFALGGLLGPLATGISLFQRYRVLGSLAAAFPRLALGMRIVGLALRFMIGPWGLVIAAVGIAAFFIIKHWDTIKTAFNDGVERVKGTLSALPEWLKSVGRLMMNGLLLAINPLALAKRLLLLAKNGVTAFKNFLGIKSPSRVFMAIGGQTAEGMALGISRNQGRPVQAMGRLARGVTAAGALGVSALGGTAATAAGGGQTTINVTINVYQQPGQDAREMAREIQREISKLDTARARGSYEDTR